MFAFLARAVVTALIFCFVFPSIAPGVVFHGAFFPAGILWAAVFAIVADLTVKGLFVLAAGFAVAGGPLVLLVELLVFGLGFWLIPAIQLEVMSSLFPSVFSVASFASAIWASFVMLISSVLITKVAKQIAN